MAGLDQSTTDKPGLLLVDDDPLIVDALKFVLSDREDYVWATRQIEERGLLGRCPILFSPVRGELDPGKVGRWILEDGLPVRIQIQLHKILWPDAERGV